ncbi:MAG: GNAT family N-acetyltransferase [Pseudomonadota bacterium]
MAGLPQGYTLRLAEERDIPQLVVIELESNELFRPLGLIPEENMEDHVSIDYHRGSIADETSFVVSDDTGTAVGFALCSERDPDLYLDEVSVHPDHGRKGIGRALVERVIEEARQREKPSVSLSTFRDVVWNAPFYATLGFREITEDDWEDWMHDFNRIQAETLDVSKRCFMRRSFRKGLFRRGG